MKGILIILLLAKSVFAQTNVVQVSGPVLVDRRELPQLMPVKIEQHIERRGELESGWEKDARRITAVERDRKVIRGLRRTDRRRKRKKRCWRLLNGRNIERQLIHKIEPHVGAHSMCRLSFQIAAHRFDSVETALQMLAGLAANRVAS